MLARGKHSSLFCVRDAEKKFYNVDIRSTLTSKRRNSSQNWKRRKKRNWGDDTNDVDNVDAMLILSQFVN